ncbi:hypothetical protein MKEN_00126500 [Mycena kentingensis (nom. inval.)]|nr:hypothetical protein MKEN_00126500 [Mycena kentingensis (nom. inval.)]
MRYRQRHRPQKLTLDAVAVPVHLCYAHELEAIRAEFDEGNPLAVFHVLNESFGAEPNHPIRSNLEAFLRKHEVPFQQRKPDSILATCLRGSQIVTDLLERDELVSIPAETYDMSEVGSSFEAIRDLLRSLTRLSEVLAPGPKATKGTRKRAIHRRKFVEKPASVVWDQLRWCLDRIEELDERLRRSHICHSLRARHLQLHSIMCTRAGMAKRMHEYGVTGLQELHQARLEFQGLCGVWKEIRGRLGDELDEMVVKAQHSDFTEGVCSSRQVDAVLNLISEIDEHFVAVSNALEDHGSSLHSKRGSDLTPSKIGPEQSRSSGS